MVNVSVHALSVRLGIGARLKCGEQGPCMCQQEGNGPLDQRATIVACTIFLNINLVVGRSSFYVHKISPEGKKNCPDEILPLRPITATDVLDR